MGTLDSTTSGAGRSRSREPVPEKYEAALDDPSLSIAEVAGDY
jgi:hypothetical protein